MKTLTEIMMFLNAGLLIFWIVYWKAELERKRRQSARNSAKKYIAELRDDAKVVARAD